jgi:hypothetical protein
MTERRVSAQQQLAERAGVKFERRDAGASRGMPSNRPA